MHARKVTLVEMGAGGLPVVTPVVRRRSSWFPKIYVPPAVPPVDGVLPNPVADGVLIEWAPVDQEGVVYIIERGPSETGPWTEIARVTETRYLYSDGSGLKWWFRITASVRGKAGEGTVVEGTAGRVPSYAEMEELNRKFGQEILDRLAGDLEAINEATSKAREYTDTQVAALNGILEDIVGADEWTAEGDYPQGDFVQHDGTLYRALQPSTGVQPGSDPAIWQEIGDYTSVGDALAASIRMGTQNATDISAQAGRIDAVVVKLPSDGGQAASSGQVATQVNALAEADRVLAERVDTTNAELVGKASNARVNSVEQASVSRDDALADQISTTNAALDGKASTDTVQQLESKVSAQEGKLEATSQAVTQVKASLAGGANMLKDGGFSRGFTYWSQPFGSAIYYEPKYGNYLAVNAVAGGTASEQRVETTAGIYVFSAEIYRNSDGGNVRVEVGAFSAQGFIGSATALSERSKVGQWQQVFIAINAPPGTSYLNCRIIFEGTNTINSVRRAKLELGLTPTLWTDDTAVDISASATQALAVRATQLENGQSVLMAQYNVVLDVNGRIVGQRAVNDGRVGRWDFVADIFSITDPNNTGSTTFEQGRWITRSGGYMLAHGKPFGTTGDLMMWLGVGSDPAVASKANGMFWIDNKGNGYFGGSLSAGTLRNAVQTTTIQTVGTQLENGPFTTNGGVRQVVLSFSRQIIARKNAGGAQGFVAGPGENRATIQLYRKIGTGAETLFHTMQVGGQLIIRNEADAPDQLQSIWAGSMTVSDSSPSTSTVYYRAVITALEGQAYSHQSGSWDSTVTTQNLAIISVEQ